MKEIEIRIHSDGHMVLETRGYTGPECREASALLEAALGRRTAEQLTSEFHTAHSAPRLEHEQR